MCLSVFFRMRDISITDTARITELFIKMSHHKSWKLSYFGVKRSKVKVTSHKKHCRRGSLHTCECWLPLVSQPASLSIAGDYVITGPPTHSVGDQTSNGSWRLSSSVGICSTPRPACRRLHARRPGDDVIPPAVYSTATLHGGPVPLRPVRATPCCIIIVVNTYFMLTINHQLWRAHGKEYNSAIVSLPANSRCANPKVSQL